MTQRSPINAVLLAAATLALDAVAITWLAQASVLSEAPYLYDALVSAQLALVCLWAVFASRYTLVGWLAAIVAVLVVSTASTHISAEMTFAEEFGSNGSYVAALAIALWVLKRTEFWRRLTGAGPVVWQYSITHLLGVMTLVAVLVVSLRHTELLTEWWKPLVALTVGDVVIAVATTVIWAGKEHAVIRLAAICAAAIVVGLCEARRRRSCRLCRPQASRASISGSRWLSTHSSLRSSSSLGSNWCPSCRYHAARDRRLIVKADSPIAARNIDAGSGTVAPPSAA